MAWRGAIAVADSFTNMKGTAMSIENNLRHRARRGGLQLLKYRETSRWYGQYGPYAIADRNGALIAYGLDLNAVAVELDG